MIAKGTTHNNGARLASYMVTSKDGERAQLHELRGFAEADIVDAFRSVHVMAEATRCDKPFYHCQIRTPDGEALSREQWLEVADRIETKLGLAGQPRAIAFHDKDGHEHMHVAWSRIDDETMTAKELKFDHTRLKEVCRELELEMGLTVVRNDRAPNEPPAPLRDEFDEANRLGVDVKAVRQTIRNCWEQADSGSSFMAALSEHELTLAQGERRDYVVIDHEGGLHALGKRILGTTAAETRERLSDLDRTSLPTVEAAREALAHNTPLHEIEEPAQQQHTRVSFDTDHAEHERMRASTCTDHGGMVAQQAEANRRHLELNPFLKHWRETPAQQIGGERQAVERESEEPAARNVSDGSATSSNTDLADQILERWRQQRDRGRGHER